jgi:hypothetical protein
LGTHGIDVEVVLQQERHDLHVLLKHGRVKGRSAVGVPSFRVHPLAQKFLDSFDIAVLGSLVDFCILPIDQPRRKDQQKKDQKTFFQ